MTSHQSGIRTTYRTPEATINPTSIPVPRSEGSVAANPSPTEILAGAQAGRFVVQDFRPLAESIEWELSRLYFEERGSKAFVTGNDHVPFEINNNGNLSLDAAEVFFAGLVAADT